MRTLCFQTDGYEGIIFSNCVKHDDIVFSEFVLNMKALYHGTDAPVEVISEEGLDDRLSSKGHFGKGIYFRYQYLLFINC